MKNIKTSLFLILAVVALSFTSCKKPKTQPTPDPTLGDLIKGKTYKLGSVKEGATDVSTSKFNGFTIKFDAAGTGVTFNCGCASTTGGTLTNATANYTAAANTITFTGQPNAWPASFSNVVAGANGVSLGFNATVGISGKTSQYTFALIQ